VIRLLAPSTRSDLPGVRLDGTRCYIRPPRPSDWRAWVDLRARSRAFLEPWEPLWPTDATTRQAFMRRYRNQLDDWQAGRGYAFLLWRQADDTLLGGVSLSHVRFGVSCSASLGYWMGEQYAGHGYMAEGVRRVLDFAFDHAGLHRVEAAFIPENDRSRRLLEKVGFTVEGYARKYLRINGRWQDHVLTAILAEDPRSDG
jgi:ribosomal-protein-alanine N-acetyltransferase